MSEKVHIDDATLRTLLPLVSHDLRNPLAAIVTNLEFAKGLVQEEGVDVDLRESVEDSVIACDVLRRIVANFDLIITGQQTTTSPERVDVAAMVKEIAKRCRDQATQADLRIEVDAETGDEVVADKDLIGLAIENLLANSIQHAPRNSTVEIGVAQGEGQLIVTVFDTGPPVPAELRQAALSAESHTPTGRRGPTRYGRGLSLLASRAAAAAAGATLLLGERDEKNEMTLAIPTRPRSLNAE